MFEILSDFVDSISSFKINIPLSVQITILVIIIILLSVGAYFMRDFFDISYMRNGMTWFVFIAILNLSTMLVIFIYYDKKFIYYNKKLVAYIGGQGQVGKKGKMGKKGKSVTCSDCKNNLYLQSVRKNSIICVLSIFTNDFKAITNNLNFFQKIINKGNSISYDSFVNGIILGKSIESKNVESVNKFTSLMTPSSITFQLVQIINDTITKASHDTYGTFRTPFGKIGSLSIGDNVYGGLENFILNSFMVNGDIMYPSQYNKLVTFTSYNDVTKDTDTYTLWRPIGQTNIQDNSGFRGAIETFNYLALGDICRSGTKKPQINEIATIKETCLEPIQSKDLHMVFLYIGALNFADESNTIDYTQTDTYLIENKVANDIQMFSVWRTPLNTFITNSNFQNTFVNNSFVYNMYNISDTNTDALNDIGAISTDYKNRASNLLQSIPIPKILSAAIICKHYMIELRKELIYYFNRYQRKVPEFKSTNPVTASFGDVMNIINNTNTAYEKYNQTLVKDASIAISITKPNGAKSNKYTTYDETKERHVPPQLLNAYNTINDKLLTISVEIENTDNLLDIVNIIFETGIEARIAIDADGIAEGGILINEIQQTILTIAKMLLPPTQQTYMIKDECLGIFAVNKDKEQAIKDLNTQINTYNEFVDEFDSKTDKYKLVTPNINQYKNLMYSQIGQVCGHIVNFQQKINDMNLEEFTESRIKQLITIYTQINLYFADIMSKV